MNRLKELRKEKGLTQQELADEMQTTKLTISNWENGKHALKTDKAQSLADFFKVPIGYLLGYSDYKNTDSYFEEMTDTMTLDVDILNSIDTIGEKNLPVVTDFLKREFIKEYSSNSISENEQNEAVKIAMGNVLEDLWGLPDSVVKLLLYWATLNDDERKSIFELIKILSLKNLEKKERK